ncbi:MAG TPA: hypothetical protein VGR66_01890 [Candidatus Eisenbacteria bacterium]|nr:hypothetical protein [Candidatus Eisenbacteria bacterium]
MRSRFALGAVLALALALPGALACAHDDRDISFTMNVKGDQDVITCSDVDMKFWSGRRMNDDMVNVRRDQTVSVSAPRSGALRVAASSQGAVWVQPSSNGSLSATICTVAAAESQSASNALLDQLRIVNENGELRVEGPEQGYWGAYVILSVPNETSLDMEAQNGALEARGVTGTFSLRTQNGPIAMTNVSGKVTARAANGPISFKGHEGDIDLKAENGPVSVKINNPIWSGKGLDASTENGPITVVAPDGLKTGVRIEGSDNSPLSWKGHSTMVTSDWSSNRTIVLGKGPILVRVSTVNGPVSIKSSSPASSTGGKSRI